MNDPISSVALELRRVSKHYADSAAVSELSLSLSNGEWLTLLGPSGCGKTTTLRLIGGFISPDSGEILLGGQDVSRVPPERRGLGFVFQSYALFPHMTVAKNVAFGLERQRLSRTDIHTRVADALRIVALEGYGSRKPSQLSGGQQQRVALARAIAVRPPVLLLDEPLSNLDASLRESTRVELRQLQQELGLATIFVTHDQQEALAVSDRIAVMSHGRCVEVGTPEQLYESPNAQSTAEFMGFRNFFPGRLKERLPGVAVVRLASGVTIKLRSSISNSTSAGADVTVAIRPERVELGPTGHLNGRVSEIVYLGGTVRCDVDTELGVITAVVPAQRAPEKGQQVGVFFEDMAGREVDSEQ